MRARLSADERRLDELRAVYEGIGGARRLAYAPDGTLLVSTFAIDEGPAQMLDSDASKVLRIHTDGSIPTDNHYLWPRIFGRAGQWWAHGESRLGAAGLFLDAATTLRARFYVWCAVTEVTSPSRQRAV